MNPHKRKLLVATLAGIGAAIPGIASAVNLSTDGRGQVLLYPYYTTRTDSAGNAFGTLMSVVNATGSAKAVRVRFLEGKNSREVVDFNLFLSPFDVWTAAVLPDAMTGGARIGTTDLSCTLPPFSTSPTSPFYSFTNFEYSGAEDDGAGTGLDRTKEGYFEIIEMATYTSTSTTGKAVTHVATDSIILNPRAPPCNTPPSILNDAQAATDAQPPGGGLFGGLTLINVASGTDYTADAVALANFFKIGSNYQVPFTDLPDLTQATPPVSSIHAPDGRLYESTWAAGTADPVSAVLMHDSVMNEFVLDTGTKSGTDWVVTFPTKRFYTNVGIGLAPKLFERNFNGTAGSCDDVGGTLWDREERQISIPLDNQFPQPGLFSAICWAANVITFNTEDKRVGASNVLGSTNAARFPATFAFVMFENGWLNLQFPPFIPGAAATVHQLVNVGATAISGAGRLNTGNTTTYTGLPVIGFAVTSYMNGTLQVGGQTVLSNYGGNFVHKTSTTIQ